MDVRFGTYNLLNYEGPDTAGDRYAPLVEAIRSLDVDVLAVQEILAPMSRRRARSWARSATMSG